MNTFLNEQLKEDKKNRKQNIQIIQEKQEIFFKIQKTFEEIKCKKKIKI